MDKRKKSGRRIVSKGKYLADTGKKLTLASYGTAVQLVGIMMVAFTLLVVVPTVWRWADILGGLFMVGISGGSALTLIYLGRKAVGEGKAIDAGIPFTRANTADLPAVDSLVRASDSPPQEDQDVLLRPATQGRQTPPQELVRAAIGPQDTSR